MVMRRAVGRSRNRGLLGLNAQAFGGGALGQGAARALGEKRRTDRANRLNETNPFGSTTFTDGGVERTLGGAGKVFDNKARKGIKRYDRLLEDIAASPLDIDQQVVDRTYGMYTRGLADEEGQQMDRLQSRLVAQGFDPTRAAAAQEAFSDQQEGFDDRRNNFYLQAQNQAFQQALADRQDQFNVLGANNPFLSYGAQGALGQAGPINYARQTPFDFMGVSQAQENARIAEEQRKQEERSGLFGGLADAALGIASLPMTGGASLGGMGLMGLGRSFWG